MSARQTPPRIAIIGGGITGLTAAHRLHELAASNERPLEITVFEASDRVGGALETIHHDGLTIETGADSFLSEKPWALNLAERLGLSAQLIRTQEQFRKTLVVRDGRLVPIPEGFSLMAPTYILPVLRSPLFSPAGKGRMMLEPLIPRRARLLTKASRASSRAASDAKCSTASPNRSPPESTPPTPRCSVRNRRCRASSRWNVATAA